MTDNQIAFGLMGIALILGGIVWAVWTWRLHQNRPPQVHAAHQPKVQNDAGKMVRSAHAG